MTQTNNDYNEKQSGGNGFYLAANTPYDPATHGLVLNIDILEDATAFTVLTDSDGNSLLVSMGLDGAELPATITNFTHQKHFKNIQANKGVWLNRYITK